MAENKQNTRPELEIGTAKEIEEMMKKYDRESNVRIWTGVPRKVIRYLCAAFSIYCIWVTLFSTMMPEEKLNLFLGLILVLGYLNYPISKKHVRPNYIPWYDIVIMLVGAIPFFYCALNAHSIIKLAARVTRDPKMVVMAVMAILAYMELCRRCVGIPILCVVGVLLVYAFTNVRFGKVVYDLFYTTTGIMSTPINVCAKYIVVFIIFGAFLERTGISNFFINLANSVAGASSGGPAKVAVISSALCGMVSGSSVGNTVTTGSVTIPMMKKTGYKPEFAGAVEAAASTGGQIMPPIMGAAAFLMAEYMGIPYGQVALKAILPAVLYFTGIYIAVHLEAKKLGLKGIPREELPRLRTLLPRVYLLLPLVVLVWLVATNKRTMQFSAAVAIMITILVGLFNNVVNKMTGSGDTSDNLTLEKFVDALEAGAKSCVTVAVACAMAGLVAGSITSTGLASKLITAVVTISRGNVMIALRGYHLPRQRHDCPAADDALLHRAGHGRSDHGQLLHHGLHLRADPDHHRGSAGRGPLLRVLLRHRRRYYPAGGPGRLCRLRHCQGTAYEDGLQRLEARDCGLYRALYLRAESSDALCGHHRRPGRDGCDHVLCRHVRCGGRPERIPVPPDEPAGPHPLCRRRPADDVSGDPHRRDRHCDLRPRLCLAVSRL